MYIICFSNVFDFFIGENFVYFDLIKGDEYFVGYEGNGDGMLIVLIYFEKFFVIIYENFNLIERY